MSVVSLPTPSVFSDKYRVCENTSIGFDIALAVGICSKTLPIYLFKVNRSRNRVPCCWEVDNIFNFLNVANTPLDILTIRFPSILCGSSASESLRSRVASTNKLVFDVSAFAPTNITEGKGFRIR